MKADEFAFFNQQLAAMLRDGIPLEGALQRLAADLQRGELKSELLTLKADLARGVPLPEAVRARRLPELYVRLMEIGVRGNNLPAVLTLLADHYQRRYLVGTRLKGLLVYPLIVLAGAFLLSCFLSIMVTNFVPTMTEIAEHTFNTSILIIAVWFSPALLGLIILVGALMISKKSVRRALRWRLPAFKEASLAQAASSAAILLRSGMALDDALALVQQLETGTRAEKELAEWRKRLASGHGKFSDLASPGAAFPPLFIWMIAHSGEDIADGFQRAAELYQARASARADMLLYATLPVSVLALGLVILMQIQPVLSVLAQFLRSINDPGGIGE